MPRGWQTQMLPGNVRVRLVERWLMQRLPKAITFNTGSMISVRL